MVLDEQQEYERTLEVAHDALRDLDSGRAKLLSIGWDYEASRIEDAASVVAFHMVYVKLTHDEAA